MWPAAALCSAFRGASVFHTVAPSGLGYIENSYIADIGRVIGYRSRHGGDVRSVMCPGSAVKRETLPRRSSYPTPATGPAVRYSTQ